MSEYFFGLGRGKLSSDVYERADKIAARHGACVCNPKLPGEERKFYFACPNRGHPFDQNTERKVIADLEAAGLWPLPTMY